MGLVLLRSEQPPPPPPRPMAPRKQVVQPSPNERGCDSCPLKATWDTNASPRMPIAGNSAARVLIVGEAPGASEDINGKPFIGDSGKLLHKHLKHRDLPLIAMTNTVRCRPPANRTPTAAEAHCCSIHLENDLDKYPKLDIILGVGAAPLHRFYPRHSSKQKGGSILNIHGLKFPVAIRDRVFWYYPVIHPALILHTKPRDGGPEDSRYFPVFAADLQHFFKQWERWPKPQIVKLDPSTVTVPQSWAEAEMLVARMQEPLAIDIETTGALPDTAPKPYHKGARLLSAAISDAQSAIAFPIEHPREQTSWGLELLLKCAETRHWIAHNVAYELSWIIAKKQELRRSAPLARFEDTMALARIRQEREHIQSLEDLTQIWLGTNIKSVTNVDASHIIEYDLSEILRYNGLDALATRLLWDRLQNPTETLDDKANYRRMIEAQESVTRMELFGLHTSVPTAEALRRHWGDIADQTAIKAGNIYEVREWQRATQRVFNIQSGAHIGEALSKYGKVALPQTETGKLKTDDTVLKSLEGNPLADAVRVYREALKLKTTYIEPMLQLPQQSKDGLLHPGYTVTHVATGRLSSQNPNIQNIPKRRHRELRQLIVAPLGHKLYAFDYGQLEVRVLAMTTQDENLVKAIRTNFDIHKHWLERALHYCPDYLSSLAERLNLVGADEAVVRKRGRDIIKGDLVFAQFYGGGIQSAAERTGIPLIIMQALLREFWESYPQVKEWIRGQRRTYEKTGGVRTIGNRLRYGVMLKGNEVINTPIQGSAADLVIDSQNELSHLAVRIDEPALHPRINVHDELVFVLPENPVAQSFIDTIVNTLVKVRYPWQVVPLKVEGKVGDNWCDMQEFIEHEGDYNH